MTEKAILLFTTDTLPYALHNINILSFPQGLSYRFRYKKETITNALLDLIPSRRNDKKRICGYVIFRFNDGTYFPYRRVELISSYDYGHLCFFNTELGGIVDSERSSLAAMTEDINALINKEELPPKKLVHLVNLPTSKLNIVEEADDRSNNAWANSVDILSEAEHLKGQSFFRFEMLRGIKEREKLFPSILSGNMRGYKLPPGKDFLIQFFEYTTIQPHEKDESIKMFSISLKSDPDKVEIIKPEEIIDGRYDMFDLVFSTLAEASSDTAYLRIENTQSKDDRRLPTIYIPYCVSLSPIWRIARPILLLISIIAFVDPKLMIWIINSALGVFPIAQEALSKIFWQGNKEKWVQVIAIFMFVFSFWNFSFRSALKNIKDLLK